MKLPKVRYFNSSFRLKSYFEFHLFMNNQSIDDYLKYIIDLEKLDKMY